MARCLAEAALPLLLLAGSVGCDRGGYADLGEPIDITEQCELANGTSTWIRAESDPAAADPAETVWTYYVVVGAEDPASLAEGDGCLDEGSLDFDGEIDLRQGRYHFADGKGSAYVYAEYTFEHQPDVSVLQRLGARRESFEDPPSFPVSFAVDASDATKLDITIDGVTHTYDNLIRLMASFDYASQDGAEKAAMLFNVAKFVRLSRLSASMRTCRLVCEPMGSLKFFEATKSSCQNQGRLTMFRSALPNGLLGSVWFMRFRYSMASSACAVMRFHVPRGLPSNG